MDKKLYKYIDIISMMLQAHPKDRSQTSLSRLQYQEWMLQSSNLYSDTFVATLHLSSAIFPSVRDLHNTWWGYSTLSSSRKRASTAGVMRAFEETSTFFSDSSLYIYYILEILVSERVAFRFGDAFEEELAGYYYF